MGEGKKEWVRRERSGYGEGGVDEGKKEWMGGKSGRGEGGVGEGKKEWMRGRRNG